MIPCETCNKPKQLPCPCGECSTVTNVRYCPTCEPEKHAKWNTAHGVAVCMAYAEKQLGGG